MGQKERGADAAGYAPHLIAPRDLPAGIGGARPGEARRFSEDILSGRASLKEIMAEMERDFLRKAIEAYGSVQAVAELFT